MKLNNKGLAALATALLATTSFAQTNFPEVEPNSAKSEATAVTGITANDTITGTTTGTGAVTGDTALTSQDTYRVKTAALPVGIYRHRLTLTTSDTVKPTSSIRGLNQTGTAGTCSTCPGTGGTPGITDTTIQTASTTSVNPAPLTVQWYGFGKQEELYYRVTGTTATTSAYTSTLSTSTIAATVVPQAFESANPITITTVGEATADTDIHVYDSGLNSLPGFDNDDEGPFGSTLQSKLIRTFAPGTYFLAVGRFQTAWNHPAPTDEDFPTGTLMDFPNSLVCSSTLPTTGIDDRDVRISGSNGTLAVPNQVASPDSFSIQWFQFTVAAGAPPIITPPPANDNCASAIALPAAAGTTTGTMAGATNDGAASCDPGGLASKDVWYTYTNTAAAVRILSVSTCGTTGVNDTVVSVYASCGGTELGCNDNNAGCAAQPLSSLVSGIALNPAQTVVIRVSDKGLGITTGGFNVVTTVAVPPPPNDDCTAPIVLTGLGTFAVNNAGSTTSAQGQTEAICNQNGGPGIVNDVWYTWTATHSGPVNITSCGQTFTGTNDPKIAIYNGVGCPTAGTAIACNDDQVPQCGTSIFAVSVDFNAVCGTTYTIQFGMWYGYGATTTYTGNILMTTTGTPCSTPSTAFCDGSLVGACLACGNNGAPGRGCASSGFAAGGLLGNSGIASVGTDTLVLTASDITGPGLFFQSNGVASINPFGDGMLCAAVGIIRLGVVFPVAGSASYPGGLTPFPISIAGAPIAAGDIKNYQCWYRDSPAFCSPSTFNLTNGITLTWVP